MDRPILFSGPMVRALLDGRKTQTRRILKDQPGEIDRPFMMDDGSWHVTDSRGGHMSPLAVRFAKGDRLWVKETHSVGAWDEDGTVWIDYTADSVRSRALEPPDEDFVERLCAKLDKAGVPTKDNGFYGDDIPDRLLKRVSIHMPRWASRLTLAVTDVRVQKIQDIRHADAVAEGPHPFAPHRAPQGGSCDGDPSGFDDCARCAFRRLWADINGGKTWYDNVWVVAVSFTVEKRNIDSEQDAEDAARRRNPSPSGVTP